MPPDARGEILPRYDDYASCVQRVPSPVNTSLPSADSTQTYNRETTAAEGAWRRRQAAPMAGNPPAQTRYNPTRANEAYYRYYEENPQWQPSPSSAVHPYAQDAYRQQQYEPLVQSQAPLPQVRNLRTAVPLAAAEHQKKAATPAITKKQVQALGKKHLLLMILDLQEKLERLEGENEKLLRAFQAGYARGRNGD